MQGICATPKSWDKTGRLAMTHESAYANNKDKVNYEMAEFFFKLTCVTLVMVVKELAVIQVWNCN